MLDWPELESACLSCQKCALAETRHNVVFGDGARNAEVMFIGEGPGEQEDLTGKPFVGKAGKLLDDMLTLIDLDRSKIFIGNTVKCRPPQNIPISSSFSIAGGIRTPAAATHARKRTFRSLFRNRNGMEKMQAAMTGR